MIERSVGELDQRPAERHVQQVRDRTFRRFRDRGSEMTQEVPRKPGPPSFYLVDRRLRYRVHFFRPRHFDRRFADFLRFRDLGRGIMGRLGPSEPDQKRVYVRRRRVVAVIYGAERRRSGAAEWVEDVQAGAVAFNDFLDDLDRIRGRQAQPTEPSGSGIELVGIVGSLPQSFFRSVHHRSSGASSLRRMPSTSVRSVSEFRSKNSARS